MKAQIRKLNISETQAVSGGGIIGGLIAGAIIKKILKTKFKPGITNPTIFPNPFKKR